MASNIPITQGMPAHYFKGGGRRPGRGSMAPRRATISIGGGKSEGSSGGAPSGPASRDIPMGEGEQGPPQQETQAPIEATGRNPRFAVGNAANGQIDLGSLLSARTNASYDPTKAIGGENVPFKETTGVGGFFRRMFGDDANEKNLTAQAQQGAEWKADEASAKALAAEDARWQKRFDAESGFKSTEAEKERNARATLSQAELAAQKERFDAEQNARTLDRLARGRMSEADDIRADEQLKAQREYQNSMLNLEREKLNAKPKQTPHVQFDKDSGTAIIATPDSVQMYEPPRLPMGKIPGRVGGMRTIWPAAAQASGVPTAQPGEAPVNPVTGQPIGEAPARPEQAPVTSARRPSYLMGALENVAGALGLDDISLPTPSLTASPEDIRAAAVKRARYLDPSMQRTY